MIKWWFDKYRQGRASHRIRSFHQCQELVSQGYDAKITNNLEDISADDIVIFQKDSTQESFNKLKNTGAKIGFDLCDNKFEEQPNYYDFCKQADFITVNSEIMKEVVKQEVGRNSYYYPDCVDRKIIPAVVRSVNKPVKLLWYGSSSSNKYVDWLAVTKLLESSGIDYKLILTMNKAEGIRGKIARNLSKNNPGFSMSKMENIEWSWDMQGKLVEECDVVFIPLLGQNERRTKTKSPNRVVDAIAQGRWVVTSPIPSYEQLKDFCWIGNPVDGIRYYLRNQSEAVNKINKGQQWIQENVGPEACAKFLINIYNEVRK